MIFYYGTNLTRHEKTCCVEQEEIFVGGKNKKDRTLFERLEEVGYVVSQSDRFYPYNSSFDFESLPCLLIIEYSYAGYITPQINSTLSRGVTL